MKTALFFLLLSIPLVSMKCTESCDNYNLQGDELRIINDLDPALIYVNADHSDTLRVTSTYQLDQGPDKERKNWTKGYRSCGSAATMDYGNSSKAPYFRILFDLNKQHANAIEIPSVQVGRVMLKKSYDDDRNSYSIHNVGETEFKGRIVEEVYEITGTAQEAGNSYMYSLYEGLLRIEEQGKSWQRIW
ncbi:MAG: hypothetical protein H7282_02890 [Cytophagaceae bacterium]|nr:hypothetical protein [Cytophagaceae bacterium]